jgi:uncharacterized protein (DUF433 family)
MQRTVTDHIEIRKNRRGEDRAFIAGTRVRVRDIYAHAEVNGENPEQIIAALPHLSLAQVHAALAYYFDHREAILDEIRSDEGFVNLMRAQTGPGPLERMRKATDADDEVSSG